MSCNDDTTVLSLDNIGDSIIERWDIYEYFSTWQVYNCGVSGASLDYIEVNVCRFVDKKWWLVMIDTNNINDMVPRRIEKYVERNMPTIEGLGVPSLYLYSLHPRNFRNDRSDGNTDKPDFNDRIWVIVSGVSSRVYLDDSDLYLRRRVQSKTILRHVLLDPLQI